MRRVILAAFLSAVLPGAVVPRDVFAQAAADDWTRCGNAKENADVRIPACTAIIDRGQDTPARLASAFNNRGNIYRRKGDVDRAIADYGEAIRLNAKYALPLSNRGFAYLKKGDADHALADWDAALQLDAKLTAPLYCRGVLKLAKGDSAGRADMFAAVSLVANIAEREAKTCPMAAVGADSANAQATGVCRFLQNNAGVQLAVTAVEAVLRLRGDSSSLTRVIVPLFTTHISESDLRRLVTFYQSPGAQSLGAAAQPMFMRNTNDATRQCLSTLGSAVAQDLSRRGITLR